MEEHCKEMVTCGAPNFAVSIQTQVLDGNSQRYATPGLERWDESWSRRSGGCYFSLAIFPFSRHTHHFLKPWRAFSCSGCLGWSNKNWGWMALGVGQAPALNVGSDWGIAQPPKLFPSYEVQENPHWCVRPRGPGHKNGSGLCGLRAQIS